jgi:hypothetical protein
MDEIIIAQVGVLVFGIAIAAVFLTVIAVNPDTPPVDPETSGIPPKGAFHGQVQSVRDAE